jgi:hypothetical protein
MSCMPSRVKKALMTFGLSATLLLFPFAASAAATVRSHDFDSGRRSFYYYPGFYDGYWGFPLWGSYFTHNYNPTGTIKLENVVKTDQIYINGAYLGEARRFGSISLYPGAYILTVRNNGNDLINQTVYVAKGITTKLKVGDKG